jgi:hypothetical protein
MTIIPKSTDGLIENVFFGEGYYNFALPLAQLERLQTNTDKGPLELYDCLMNRTAKTADILETIRLGLIGGGNEAQLAHTLVQNYWSPLATNIPLALLIISAVLFPASNFSEEELDLDTDEAEIDLKKN